MKNPITRRNALISGGAILAALLGGEFYKRDQKHAHRKLENERKRNLPGFEKSLDAYMHANLNHPGPFGKKPTGGMKVLFLENEDGSLSVYSLRKGAGSDVNLELGIISLYNGTEKRKTVYFEPNAGKATMVHLDDPLRVESPHQLQPEIVEKNKEILRTTLSRHGIKNPQVQDGMIQSIFNEGTDANGYPGISINKDDRKISDSDQRPANAVRNFVERIFPNRKPKYISSGSRAR